MFADPAEDPCAEPGEPGVRTGYLRWHPQTPAGYPAEPAAMSSPGIARRPFPASAELA